MRRVALVLGLLLLTCGLVHCVGDDPAVSTSLQPDAAASDSAVVSEGDGGDATAPPSDAGMDADADAVALATGELRWSFVVPAASEAVAVAIRPSDGHVIIAGHLSADSAMVAGTTLTRIGIRDLLVVELDTAGQPVWAKNYGATGSYVLARAVAVVGSEIIVSGSFRETDFAGLTAAQFGEDAPFVLRINGVDPTHPIAWSRRLLKETNNGGTCTSLAVGVGGQIAVGCYVFEVEGPPLTPTVPRFAMTALEPSLATSATGTLVAVMNAADGWGTWATAIRELRVQSVLFGPGDLVYAGGEHAGATAIEVRSNKSVTAANVTGHALFKLSSTTCDWAAGWSCTSGDSNQRAAYALLPSSDVAIANAFGGTCTLGNVTAVASDASSQLDMLVARFDHTSGNPITPKAFGGAVTELLGGIAASPNGDTVLWFTGGGFTLGSKTVPTPTTGTTLSVLTRLDPSAEPRWLHAMPTSPSTALFSLTTGAAVATSASGEIVVASQLRGSTDLPDAATVNGSGEGYLFAAGFSP